MGAWILRLIILCYGLVAAQENPDPGYEKYENCQVVSVARDLRIYWTVSDGTLKMAMGGNFYKGNPTWMALAWSVGTPQQAIFENQEHPKALGTVMDVWLVGYDPAESESVSESCSNGLCVVDLTMTLNKASEETQKDLNYEAGQVSGDRLRAEWSRLLNTTDLADVVITEGEEMVLNWSGEGPYKSGLVDGEALLVGKHNLRAVGSARVTFAAGATSTCDEVESEGNSWADPGGYFSVKWAITATHIEVEMTGKTTGWVGIGWCNTAIMDKCDMITGWIADGVVEIHDTYSPSKIRPPFDTEAVRGGTDDVEDADGEEVDGQTTLRFSRKLVTGDTDNDEDIIDKDFYLQWAIHPEDGIGTAYKEHDRYGIGIVNFITGAQSSVSTQDAGWTLVFAVWLAFCVYLAVRISYRAHKRWTKRDFQKTRDRIDGKEHVGVEEASGTDNSAGASYDNGGLVRHKSMMMKQPMRPPQRNALPTAVHRRNMSCGFYQGSTFVGTADWYYQDEFALQIGPVTYEELQRLFQKGTITAETCVWKESLGSDWIPIAAQPKFMSSLEAGSGPGPIEMISISETSTVTKVVTETVPESELGGAAGEGVRAKPVNSKKLAQRAWLNRRVPYFHLPVSGLLAAFIFLGLNLACLSVGVHTLSVKTGYLAAANSFLLAVPATRNSVLTWLFAASFDQVIVLHRMLGQWTVFLVTLHMVLSWGDWAPTMDFAAIMEKQFTEEKYLYGWLSWFAGAFIFVSSLGYFRRKHFEWFYYLHFTFAFFYAFAFMHSDAMRPYLIATLVVYLTDRGIRMFWGLNPQRAQLALVRDDVITIRFAKHPVASCLDMYDVGQYVFINVPSISLLEWHPFSLSSGPRERTLEVTIRGLGDHTNRLVALASKSTSTTWIRVDGPYGNQKANLRRFPVMILIGGGVGVTPLIGLMKDIFNIGDTEKPPQPSAMQHVYLSWSTRNESTYLAFADHINQVVKAASDDPSLPSFTPILHITSSHNQPGVRSGRPVLPTLFEQVATECPNQAATVFACGPTALVNQAWDTAQRRQKSGQRFDFHHETFEF